MADMGLVPDDHVHLPALIERFNVDALVALPLAPLLSRTANDLARLDTQFQGCQAEAVAGNARSTQRTQALIEDAKREARCIVCDGSVCDGSCDGAREERHRHWAVCSRRCAEVFNAREQARVDALIATKNSEEQQIVDVQHALVARIRPAEIAELLVLGRDRLRAEVNRVDVTLARLQKDVQRTEERLALLGENLNVRLIQGETHSEEVERIREHLRVDSQNHREMQAALRQLIATRSKLGRAWCMFRIQERDARIHGGGGVWPPTFCRTCRSSACRGPVVHVFRPLFWA